MGKKKDNISGDGVVKNNNSKLPLLIFLIGLFLIVAGFLMQIGWFGESEPVPTKEANNQQEENEATDENSSDESNILNIKSGDVFTLDVSSTYSFEDGLLTINATNVISTCDASNVCGAATDIVELNVLDKEGNSNAVQLTPANLTAAVGTYVITLSKWGNGEVDLMISSSEAETNTDTQN